MFQTAQVSTDYNLSTGINHFIYTTGLLGIRKISYPYDTNETLTSDSLLIRINNVFKYIDFGQNYYWITSKLDKQELESPKWKTYLYLRKCVLEYRRGDRTELEKILEFLSSQTNKTWLTERLLDHTLQTEKELWTTSKHEWLLRSLIVDVIERSAGMVEGIECETPFGCTVGEGDIDWLYVQAVLRSPNKYIFFKNKEYAIHTGHVGAVKNIHTNKFEFKGSPAFHQELKKAFFESTTIRGFLKRVGNIFRQAIFSGKKQILPDYMFGDRYVVDGSSTANERQINLFRRNKLRPEGYEPFRGLLGDLIDFTIYYGNEKNVEQVEEVDSENSDDELA